MMDKEQKFLRRQYLLDNMPLILREAAYHRRHEEDEACPYFAVWEWEDVDLT